MERPRRLPKAVKIILISVGGLAVLLAALVLVAEHFIIPGIAASKVQAALAEQWDGDVKVGSVDFSFTGPITVRDVALRDRQGRHWLSVGQVRVTLRDWPGASPVVTGIAVQDVAADTYFADGQLRLPLRPPAAAPAEKPGRQVLDLQTLTVDGISFSINDEAGKASWQGLAVKVEPGPGGGYHVAATTTDAAKAAGTITAAGTVGRNLGADIHVKLDLLLSEPQMRTVLRAVRAPMVQTVGGQLVGEFDFAGMLTDWHTFSAKGSLAVRRGSVMAEGGYLVRSVEASVAMDGRKLTLQNLTADLCGGRVSGRGEFQVDAHGDYVYRADVEASDVDLPRLMAVVSPGKQSQRGKLKANVQARGDSNGASGKAAALLSDGDLMNVDIFHEIFGRLGVAGNEQATHSNAAAVFQFNNSKLLLESGHLANGVSALEAQPKGMVDVATRQVDMHVVAVPLAAVRSLLDAPGLNLITRPLTHLADNATAFHVKGDWNQPASQLVKVEPVGNLTKASTDFFVDAAKSGGQLGEGVMKGIGATLDLFKSK